MPTGLAACIILRLRHSDSGGKAEHARLIEVAALTNVFQELRVCATLTDGRIWHLLHAVPNVVAFELAHGAGRSRAEHNIRSIEHAVRKGRTVIDEHAGFSDLFAPVARTGTVLVVGPFSTARPTSAELELRWQAITGTPGRVADPEFSKYVATALAAPVLAPAMLTAFRRFAEVFCALLAGRGDTGRLSSEAALVREELVTTRVAERCWEAAATMVDARTVAAWTSPDYAGLLRFLGVRRVPEHAVVGLLSGRADQPDPVQDLVQRDALQRAAVELARRTRGIVCGRVGEHGTVFLVDSAAKGARRIRAELSDIGERARALARRFGYRLHVGASFPDTALELPARYRAALSAAGQALARGVPMVFAQALPRVVSPLGDLRRQLARAVVENPGAASALFDRYMEAVGVHTGYALEATRAHVEAGFDQVLDALQATEALDERGLSDLRETLERAAQTGTVEELVLATRRGIAQLLEGLVRPSAARRDRGIERALSFIREHLSEPLPLARVARVAGFAPAYFSRLFAARQKQPFQRYTQAQRVARARQLLETTTLAAERIGQLSGFRTPTRFHAAFKEALGKTPRQYRRNTTRK